MARVKTGQRKTAGVGDKVGGRKKTGKTGTSRRKPAETSGIDGKSPVIAARQDRAREIILGELRKARSISGACEEAEIARSTFAKWRREDKDFADEVEDALAAGTEALEDEAVRRGKNGYRKAVYHQGEVVGYERRYSDRMLEVMLEARNPSKFRKNHSIEVQGQMTHTVTQLSKEELIEAAKARGLPTEIFEK